MIRCLFGDKPKLWDVSLAQAEFAYNSVIHSLSGFSPFDVVYTTLLRQMVDMVLGNKNIQASKMVEEVHATLEVFRDKITNQMLSTRLLRINIVESNCSSGGNDGEKIEKLAEEYMEQLEHGKKIQRVKT
ncbi:RNA-directed DNA polymerase [Tanacetum coccineum]